MIKLPKRLVPHAILLAIVAVVLAIGMSPLGDGIQVNADMPLFYRARAAFGLGPGLDPRIKIFAFDDLTVARLRDLDLGLDDWAKVFEAIDRRHPRAILIDKLFDKFYAQDEVDRFRERMGRLTTRVVIISFVSPDSIPGRGPLELDAQAYDVGRITSGRPATVGWLAPQGGTLYGAPARLVDAFGAVGNAVYRGDGRVHAVYRLDDGRVLPHWALQATGDFSVKEGRFEVAGVALPVDHRGRLPVNVDRRDVYAKRAFGMLPLITKARQGGEIGVVGMDDFVVILPGMFTGATDWVVTPSGIMQGGYLMAAMVNSVIRGDWLREAPGFPLFIVAFGAIGGLLARRLQLRYFWAAVGAAALTTATLLFAIFCIGKVYVPWILPETALIAGALGVFANRVWRGQIEQVRMQKEMETSRLVQASFVPPSEGGVAGLEIASMYLPASECGGDLWAHQTLAPGLECFMICDATGHGASAALIAAMAFSGFVGACQDYLDRAPAEVSPGQILARLNRIFRRTSGRMATMTASILVIDLRRHVVTIANGGHSRPYLIRAGAGIVRPRVQGSDIIGLSDEYPVTDHSFEIAVGDRLVLFTDGLLENVAADTLKQQAEFMDGLLSMSEGGVAGLRQHIQTGYMERLGTAALRDDVTVVVIGLVVATGDLSAPDARSS